MNRTAFLSLSLLVLLAGCAPDKGKTSAEATPAKDAQPVSGETKTVDPAPKAPTAKLSDVPANLAHDGYAYYGLGSADPITLKVSSNKNPNSITGMQRFVLREVKDGKAIFVVERTGGLEPMGTNDLTVEADGVFVTGSSKLKTGERELEIPADVSKGKTWTTTTEASGEGTSLKLTSTFTSMGIQKVKTEVGQYDALVVTSKGSGERNGDKVTMESKHWFVKGKGAVRAELKTIYPNKDVEIVTIEETK